MFHYDLYPCTSEFAEHEDSLKFLYYQKNLELPLFPTRNLENGSKKYMEKVVCKSTRNLVDYSLTVDLAFMMHSNPNASVSVSHMF